MEKKERKIEVGGQSYEVRAMEITEAAGAAADALYDAHAAQNGGRVEASGVLREGAAIPPAQFPKLSEMDPATKSRYMNALASLVNLNMPAANTPNGRAAFVLLVCEPGEGGTDVSYVSSVHRADAYYAMINLLQKWRAEGVESIGREVKASDEPRIRDTPPGFPEYADAGTAFDAVTRTEANRQGQWAFIRGMPQEDNPYAADDPARGWWQEGYRLSMILEGM